MNSDYETEARYGRWQTAMLGGVVLLAVLLILNLALLFYVYREVAERGDAVTTDDIRALEKSVTYYRAQYEQQKVQLYELDNRLTQAEGLLISLEKGHEND